MPAHKLSTSEISPRYSIVGVYSNPTSDQFVRHAAILADETRLQWGQPAKVWHMGPPLVAGNTTRETPGAKPNTPVHLVGVVPLDLDDQEGMQDWLEEVDKEPPPNKPFKRYVVRPHYDWYAAPETGRPLYRRFSCVGFVLECYRSIGIDLVNTNERNLPDIELDTLVKAYPAIEREETLERLGITRDDLGIGGDGPWRILLVGYVFHALHEPTDEGATPETHTPKTVDEAYFPRPVS